MIYKLILSDVSYRGAGATYSVFGTKYDYKLQKTAFSLVKSRLALLDHPVGWLVVRLSCHHAGNGQIHRKTVVYCPIVITSRGGTLFQTRPDLE